MMSSLDLPVIRLEALAELARTAGLEIERYKSAGFGSRHKDDGSLVTEADHAAEAIILDGLQQIAPGVPVVAEERAAMGQDPRCEGSFFLVDPLDGTRDFVESDLGEYAVNIAYLHQGRPIMGVIYAPAAATLFAGGPDGAWMELGGARQPLRTPAEMTAGIKAVVSRQARNQRLDRFLAAAAPGGRLIGSSSLKFTKLARGEAQLYPRFSPVSEWDVAAGDALLSAMGGGVMGPDGQPLRYGRRQARYLVDGFIAYANASARQAALQALVS
jgi:3'(2'), 5'-bisphosphate nucleotidase